MKKTLVLGASPNPGRYAHKAVKSLLRHDYDVLALGFRSGKIKEVEIQTGKPELHDIDTVLLYVGPERQPEYYDYLLELKPRRIIFNPGTFNREFIAMADKQGIQTVVDCALALINAGEF